MEIALCCIGKLENNYIREFVEYYKSIGTNHIFLYDNNNDSQDINVPCGTIVENKDKEEHFETVIGDYIDEGYVEVINFRNHKICQLDAYQNCYDIHNHEYDWIMFFDCDEFLTFENITVCDLQGFLSQKCFSPYNIIHINMITYDDNNLLKPDGRGCLERFTHMAEDDKASFNKGVKSIIRGGLEDIQWVATPHAPVSKYSTCDCRGQLINKKSGYPFKLPDLNGAYLKHFKCKTITEYITNKMIKGYPDQSTETAKQTLTLDNFFNHNIYTEEKKQIALSLINKIKENITIEAHIICFNEAQITPFALQYWKRNFNHVYIYDNGSTDGTLEMFSEEPFITIYRFDTKNTFDDSANKFIKNTCWKNSTADFVVVSDFDEFIYSPNLLEELEYMREQKMTIAKLNGYDMVCDTFPQYNENKLSIEIIQMGSFNEMMCKPILFSPKYITEINYCCGAHFCDPRGTVKWYDRNKIFLLHHKFLSLDYMTQKYISLGERLSQYNKESNLGMHYLMNETDKKAEFDYVKETAINVWEYTNSTIEKSKATTCVTILNGELDDMLYQIKYGIDYATENNKNLMCCALDKDTYQIYKTLRSTLFKNIRCVDNIYLLQIASLHKIDKLSTLESNIPCDVIINIKDKVILGNNINLKEKLNISEKIVNMVKETYSHVDFNSIIGIYIKDRKITNSIKELCLDSTNSILICGNEIDWCTKYFSTDKYLVANKQVTKLSMYLIHMILMSLCKNKNNTSSHLGLWADIII